MAKVMRTVHDAIQLQIIWVYFTFFLDKSDSDFYPYLTFQTILRARDIEWIILPFLFRIIYIMKLSQLIKLVEQL